MIAILSSRRHRELVRKEQELDGMSSEDKMAAIFNTIPNVDAAAELARLIALLGRAHDKCESHSFVGLHLQDALMIARRLRQEAA